MKTELYLDYFVDKCMRTGCQRRPRVIIAYDVGDGLQLFQVCKMHRDEILDEFKAEKTGAPG